MPSVHADQCLMTFSIGLRVWLLSGRACCEDAVPPPDGGGGVDAAGRGVRRALAVLGAGAATALRGKVDRGHQEGRRLVLRLHLMLY